MEDYSVGSLSDLITGSVTPNKKKVVKKKIAAKSPKVEVVNNELITNSPNETENLKVTGKKRKSKGDGSEPELKKSKREKKQKSISNETANTGDIETGTINDENQVVPKKSKNSKNAERRVSMKEKSKTPKEDANKQEQDPEQLARTVFVGNLPITLSTKKLKKMFMKYGKIDSVRIRGVPVANPKTPKKVAIIKKEFHPDRKSFYGFVRFNERDDAVKATEANGTVYQDHHIRVHLCDAKEKPEESKAIFVGNLSFYAEEEDLWKAFESCGPISSVRIVRDSRTGMGKGFGYVNFENSDSVTLALEMENVKLKDRELRISICNNNAAKKNTKKGKIRKIKKPGKVKQEEKKEKAPASEVEENSEKKKVADKSFQGIKFVQKKKNKLNKGLLQKKKKVKQIAPK